MKSILITGANRGLGFGFTEYYLKKQMRVVATCRFPEKADALKKLAQSCSELMIFDLDVYDENFIQSLSEKISGIKFDMVINNAGIAKPQAFGEWTQRHFMETLQVNLIGPALLIQRINRQINNHGKLIQISSGRGSLNWNQSPEDELDAYGISKAALNMLTRRMVTKLAAKKITVISLNPGWVQTDMGGKEATTTVEEAIFTMTKVIENLTLKDSGKFLSESGDIIPW